MALTKNAIIGVTFDDFANMPAVTIRNLSAEVHRAIRIRAAHNGNSTEAEIRNILEDAVFPHEQIKLGSLLVSIAKDAGVLTDAEEIVFNNRDGKQVEPVRFE